MNDITELAQSLKAAAEKATQGNWRAFKYHDGRCGIGGGHHDEIMVCEHISKRRPHDAEFIAMANPANILALVEALEKAQAGEKQWREVVDAFCADDADWHKLTNSNNELIALLSQALCKQADRIAELESRTVTDWIEHDGKWRPESLGLDELVYIKTRKQELKIPYPAGKVKGWMNTGGDMDVMAYKLASPQASTVTVKLPPELYTIGELIRTQDNRITDQPMFVVFQKREIIGSDEHSPSRICWVWDGEEVSELRAKRLEALYQDGRDTRGYDRYAMQEVDEFVTACFTEHGCKDYLRQNGHNLRLPYIYACGSFRNNEYQLVRNWLAGIKVEAD